jgi:hypothetical protein
MKNITLAVDDDVYRMARVVAAERDTSVSALVREYLISLAKARSGSGRSGCRLVCRPGSRGIFAPRTA